MNNEDIIRALEEFANWGPDDKIRVMCGLSYKAVNNLADAMHLTPIYGRRRHWEDITIALAVENQIKSGWSTER